MHPNNQCPHIKANGEQCKNTVNCYRHRHLYEEEVIVKVHEMEEEHKVIETTTKEELTMEDKLNLLDPKTRNKVIGLIESYNNTMCFEHLVDLVNGTTNLSLTGELVKGYKPRNLFRVDEEIIESREDRWDHFFEVTKHAPILVHMGVIPGLSDCDISVNFDKFLNVETMYEYIANHPEITLPKAVTLTMFYMAAQLGKVSYSNNKGFEANRSGTLMLRSRNTFSLLKDHELLDEFGETVELDTPGHLNIPSNLGMDYWTRFELMFGVDIHGAPLDNDKIILAVSKKGTNPNYRIEQTLRWIVNGNPGKVYGKRQALVKNRNYAFIHYGVILQDPFLHDVATWTLPHGTIKVAVHRSPSNAGDGAAFVSHSTMIKILKALGLSNNQAHLAVRKVHAFHDNVALPFGFFKGNIFVYDDQMFIDMFGDEVDIIFDAASFSDTPLGEEHWDRAAFLFNPITVKTNKGWRKAGAEQLALELMKVMAPEFIPTLAHHGMVYLENKFSKAYEAALNNFEHTYDEEDDGDDYEEHTWREKDLVRERIRNSKTAFYKNANRIFDSPNSMRGFAANTLADLDSMLIELDEKGYCGLWAPITTARVTAGCYSPVPVEPGSIYALRNEGDEHPWIIFVSDELMADPAFKWLMEFVDSDDSVTMILLVDEEGNYHVFLIKVPTSPNAGAILPISKEVAHAIGTMPVPMEISKHRFLLDEIRDMLDDPNKEYNTVRLGDPKQRRFADAHIKVYEGMGTKEWANEVAKISNLIGNIGTFAHVTTLAGRSAQWTDLTREEYIRKACVPMSVGVDTNVSKEETIIPIIDQIVDDTIIRIHNGSGVDLQFLNDTKKEGLKRLLTRRYELLRHRHIISPMDKPMVDEKGNIAPNASHEYTHLWEAAASIPKAMAPKLRRVAAILAAVSNGPISNYTSPVSTDPKVRQLAQAIWEEIDKAVKHDGWNWQDREERYAEIAELTQDLSNYDGYIPGSLAKALAHHHMTSENLNDYGYHIDNSVPAAVNLAVNEHLGNSELANFYRKPSLPTVFVQISEDNNLEIGEDYNFKIQATRVTIVPKNNVVTNEVFASVQTEESAVARGEKATKWANIAGDTTMTFMGFVNWSLNAEIKRYNPDPVAIFVPNMVELLDWTV